MFGLFLNVFDMFGHFILGERFLVCSFCCTCVFLWCLVGDPEMCMVFHGFFQQDFMPGAHALPQAIAQVLLKELNDFGTTPRKPTIYLLNSGHATWSLGVSLVLDIFRMVLGFFR